MTLALLPPSSKATLAIRALHSSPTRLPARVEPVNDTMSTSGWEAMASPTTGPVPETRLNTPGRQADLVHDLSQHKGVERGHLGRLEDDGAAGGQGVGDLGGDLVQRDSSTG